ncbi:unnamed protein product, partial [marine sediment metagenome]
AVQADAKSRDWRKEVEKRKTITVTARVLKEDGEILFRYFRKQGQTKSQGFRAILNNFIDNRLR